MFIFYYLLSGKIINCHFRARNQKCIEFSLRLFYSNIERYFSGILLRRNFSGVSILKYWVKIGFNENFLTQNVIKKCSLCRSELGGCPESFTNNGRASIGGNIYIYFCSFAMRHIIPR
ncbi:hypothetical protein PUN28_014855 [Cardiocondyla obscurior]|uniref:Uncharacterized protein n=1 Tax=Cardiocondyla obscurior TaxID=286306 RepID=A0AAW2EXK6_9HYME